jgi:hypothetical protein
VSGRTCFRGRGIDPAPKHVVKFAWPSDKRQREGRLLRLAKERGVRGIAEWVYDEKVSTDGVLDTITNLRRGMKFGEPRKLSSKALWVDSPTDSSQANSRTRSSFQLRSKGSIGRLTSLGIPTSSTQIHLLDKRGHEMKSLRPRLVQRRDPNRMTARRVSRILSRTRKSMGEIFLTPRALRNLKTTVWLDGRVRRRATEYTPAW